MEKLEMVAFCYQVFRVLRRQPPERVEVLMADLELVARKDWIAKRYQNRCNVAGTKGSKNVRAF